ncbi:hypothetical protein SO802_017702 [Lithocarpus litseifolius]|uniref:Uncharacterized protein n=1 Tax=Lithocarpus litseifolius TaxID=425828 RepID=A0AAW2CLQ1_9ROSI
MVPGFEILLDCNNKVLELKKEDTTWVPTNWADYMDPDAMTTLLGDAICNIEEEEYWEACQHALKSPYELRANDEDEEGGATPSDDEDGNIEDDAEANRSGPRYDKHGREISELGSYYDSKPNSSTPHIEKKDDIDARLAALDQKLMVHSLRIKTLENTEHSNERMEGGESEHLPQRTYLGNRGKHDLFDEWMDSIERMDAFVINKPTNM